MNVRLAKMPVLGVLVLFIGIWVGIRILREVKSKHFADDTISLLWINANEWVCLGVEFLLQRNDDGLEVQHRLVFDIIGHLESTEGIYEL